MTEPKRMTSKEFREMFMKRHQYEPLILEKLNPIMERKILKSPKYKAEKVFDPTWGWFDSRAEYKFFRDVIFQEKAGLIAQLHRPGSFPLYGKDGKIIGRYKPDWGLVDRSDGKLKYYDYKGMRRRDTTRIQKLWDSSYPMLPLILVGPGAK